jgi:hypothetical protein
MDFGVCDKPYCFKFYYSYEEEYCIIQLNYVIT